MRKEIKEIFPKWCSNMEQGKYTTALTDDLDSLVGCAIEKKVRGNEINYFYDFNKIYIMDHEDKRKAIGVDLAIHEGKSWCNHVVRIGHDDYINPETANMNAIYNIHRDNYFKKYAMSTTLTMWSYYNLPLPTTKEGKLLLLAIDSSFLGHYDERFKEVHNEWLRRLGFSELIDLLDEFNKKDFFQIIEIYETKSKISVNKEGFLTTKLPIDEISKLLELPIELPKGEFLLRNEFEVGTGSSFIVCSKDNLSLSKKVISFALVGKNSFKYTYKERKKKSKTAQWLKLIRG
ncbi:hypothetical protein CD798_08015 [Bacillaceae bacterium SAOS 7]|nr:hypothetical protein CD798_08015 [Bacillaceae bacterium SAOS 7]